MASAEDYVAWMARFLPPIQTPSPSPHDLPRMGREGACESALSGMATPGMTPWFKPNVPPARGGIYEVAYLGPWGLESQLRFERAEWFSETARWTCHWRIVAWRGLTADFVLAYAGDVEYRSWLAALELERLREWFTGTKAGTPERAALTAPFRREGK